MRKIAGFVQGAIISCLISATGAGIAAEPTNNNYPWMNGNNGTFHGDMATFVAMGSRSGVYNGMEAISPTGDVDYFLVTCMRPSTGGSGTVASVRIDFTNSAGDLELAAYDVTGKLLGTSTSITNSETVNVAVQNLPEVVMKVYGYLGAVNPYNVTFSCQ